MRTDPHGNQKRLIVIFLAVYFIAGTLTTTAGERDKLFIPFFHWYLFNKVPNENGEISHTIQIREAMGEKLPEPLLFNKAGKFVRDPSSNRARIMLLDIGRLRGGGRLQEAEELRARFEQAYLFSETAYDFLQVVYRPIEMFETGEPVSVQVLNTYTL